jgi:N-acetylneuraminate synthase
MSYAKGARTFERHIDIDTDNVKIADYSSLPDEIDTWFKAFHVAKRYCGTSSTRRVRPMQRETDFLDNYIRGAYAKRDLPAGHVLTADDVQLAIPVRKGQVSCREFVQGEVLLDSCRKGAPIAIDMIESDYTRDPSIRDAINNRGLGEESTEPASVVKMWRVPRPAKPTAAKSVVAASEKMKQCG